MRNTLPLFATLLIIGSSTHADSNNLTSPNDTPGIYIERSNDQSRAMVPILQSHYELCVSQKVMMQQAYAMGGAVWDATRSELPAGYIVDGTPHPEPDWVKEGVGIHTEKEYFLGEKYAHYKYKTEYSFSEDGLCSLIEQETLKIEMDNAARRYLITLKDKIDFNSAPGSGTLPLSKQYRQKRVHHTESPVLGRKKNDALLAEYKNNPQLAAIFSRLLTDSEASVTPGTGRGLGSSKSAREKLEEAFPLSERKHTDADGPRANYENLVLGQPCDIVESKTLRARIWYWQPMHKYPGVMERPIILKSEATPFGKDRDAINEATRFLVLTKIADSVFEPDAEMLRENAAGNRAPER